MSSPPTSFIFKYHTPVFIILLLGAAFLCYHNSFSSAFQFDDALVILDNPTIRNLSHPLVLWESFNTRFLTGVTFALNYHVGAYAVFGYHLVNFFLHYLNSILVYFLVLFVFQTPYFQTIPRGLPKNLLAFFAALIFLTHPLQTQAVTYLTQRAAVLATNCYLTALVLYLCYRRKGSRVCYGAAIGVTILGMLAKEMMVTLPIMILVVEIFFFGPLRQDWGVRLKRCAPFLLTLPLVPLTLALNKTHSTWRLKEQMEQVVFDVRNLWTEILAFGTSLRLMIFPAGQNLDYDFRQVQGPGQWEILLTLGIIVFLLDIAFRQYPKNRLISFCIVWLFLTRSVEFAACAVIAQDYFFEHYCYLSVVGFAVFLSWMVFHLSPKKTGICLLTCWTVVMGFLTYQRNFVWQDPVRLWQDTVRKSPGKSRPYDNLAAAYLARGEDEKAYAVLLQALKINASNPETFNNLGLIYLGRGDFVRAKENFEKTIGLNPNFAKAYSNLGLIYEKQQDWYSAENFFLKALSLSPGLTEAGLNLAALYQEKGEADSAVTILKQLLEDDPHQTDGMYQLASLYFQTGRKAQAVAVGKTLLKKETDKAVLTAAGSLFAAHSFNNLAAVLFYKAVQIDPHYPPAYLEYGKLLGNQGRFDEAIAVWQKGCRRTTPAKEFLALIEQARELSRQASQRLP